MSKLDEKYANRIYDVLVEKCRASESDRGMFLAHMSDGCREYRFGGALGSGGKFYAERNRWRVGCYREDYTQEVRALEIEVNMTLSEMFRQHRREEVSIIDEARQ